MSFEVGQRVVCVQDDWFNPELPPTGTYLPRKGCVYTVARVVRETISLEEIGPQPDLSGQCWPVRFVATWFRAVRDTDISQFEALLKPAPQPVEA